MSQRDEDEAVIAAARERTVEKHAGVDHVAETQRQADETHSASLETALAPKQFRSERVLVKP